MKIVHTDNSYLEGLAKEVDRLADEARLLLIGNVGRMEEYRWANDEATQWASVNFDGDTPTSVAIWAEAKEWTPIASANDILLTAIQWERARAFIRRRLVFREQIKKATTKADADAILQQFKMQLNYLLQGIN
jgi:hypothetical protein